MLKYEFVQIDYNGLSCQKKKRKIEHDLAYSTLNCMLDDIGIEIYEILYNENGKPYLKDEDIHFSISHTDGLVAVCISDSPVGIDCEKINPSYKEKIEHFSKRYFKENEADLIKSSDDIGVSYYFRGDVNNNYVSFGGMIWRIVRINGDGTVRIVLNDVTDVISSYYLTDSTNFKFEESNINSYLDTWLQDNLRDYTEFIANSKFCNDIVADDVYNYSAYNRIMTNKIPTLNCLGNSFGNNIGLLTIDEVVLAGASPILANTSFYLHNSEITESWYTMTGASGAETSINMFMISSDGSIKTDINGNLYRNVRPVINLIKNIKMIGSGTIDNPYRLEEEK